MVKSFREVIGRLLDCAFAGIAGGAIGGAIFGLAEASWVAHRLVDPTELRLLWWAPLVYGILFTGCGFTVAAAVALCFLILSLFGGDRFGSARATFGVSLGVTLAAAGIVIGRWRLVRDSWLGRPPDPPWVVLILVVALFTGVFAAWASAVALRRFPSSRVKRGVAAVSVFALLVFGGAVGSRVCVVHSDKPLKTAHPKATGPNMVLIVADALRADYLPIYATSAQAKTPNLDAFARDAVLFTHCFSQAAWTKPSFATMFTSLYPQTHTATGIASVLPESVTTLCEVLLEHGYYTQGFPNNRNIQGFLGFAQGFAGYTELQPDFFFGAAPSVVELSIYQYLRRVRMRIISRKVEATRFYQVAEAVNCAAFDWLDDFAPPEEQPFFLMLHYMEPHDPYMPAGQPGVGYARVQLGRPDPTKYREPMVQAYIDEIEYLDRHLGAFFEGLRKRGLYGDAAVVFTADHGEEFYDHRGWWHGATLFDEQIHVPLTVKLPQNRHGGTINHQLARHLDLAPTLLHLAGIPTPSEMCGRTLFGHDGALANADTAYCYSENVFAGNDLQAVRTRDAKLVDAGRSERQRHEPVEVYDVVADPSETVNLAGRGDPREERLRTMMDDMNAFFEAHKNKRP